MAIKYLKIDACTKDNKYRKVYYSKVKVTENSDIFDFTNEYYFDFFDFIRCSKIVNFNDYSMPYTNNDILWVCETVDEDTYKKAKTSRCILTDDQKKIRDREYHKRYHQAHKEEANAKNRERYRQNRQKYVEKARKWRLEHRERYNELQRKSVMKKIFSKKSMPDSEIEKMKNEFICHDCIKASTCSKKPRKTCKEYDYIFGSH